MEKSITNLTLPQIHTKVSLQKEKSEMKLAADTNSSVLFSTLHLIFLLFITKTFLPSPVNCLSNETDRLALLEFKSNIANDPFSVLSSWNDSANLCKWQGVTCDRKHNRVTSLDLEGKSLTGTLSPSIKNLTFLRFLNLHNNRFHKEIPTEVGRLFRLRYLNLSQNTFQGGIPVEISNCSNLRTIDFNTNNLTGKIPVELGSLEKLVEIQLHKNGLTGEIPNSLGNLSSLQQLLLGDNHLEGNIPNDLGRLTSLVYFQVSGNKLTGTIPSALYNLSSVSLFFAAANQLKGSIPTNIGLTLPKLQEFSIGGNEIHGTIPTSFTNASQLQMIDISSNKLTGQVPKNLGYLRKLNIGINFLGNNTNRDLDFMISLSNYSNLEILYIGDNNFGGILSPTIGNFSTNLHYLAIGSNQISGKIPQEIGNLVNLYMLGMEYNYFSGTIPRSFGKLVKLQFLTLTTNMLSGEIPTSFGNITQLNQLDLSYNSLQGNISSSSVWNCANLQFLNLAHNYLVGSITKLSLLYTILDVSRNALTGPLPIEIGNMKSIREFYAFDNKLSGKIPNTIGGCSSLEIFHLKNNSLQGSIPSSIVSLRGLLALDLSENNMSGAIPEGIENLLFLEYFNVSFNSLEGEVPTKGVFSNTSAVSFHGNRKLCGGLPALHLPSCPRIKQKKHKKFGTGIVLVATIVPGVILIMIASVWIFYQKKSRKNPASTDSMLNKLPRVSFKDLLQATGGFSLENMVGEGSFGSVYKGNLNLEGERLVAVKVLKLEQHGASKSFLAECKALCNVRHRNLVKLWTYCSSIDYKGNDFKALVYDLMENGNLEKWLHPCEDGSNESTSLSLAQRLRVAIDVSSALHYLQDDCETPTVHCDLKPSNILFDSDMTAHVGDFGLARLLSNNFSQGQSSSTGIKGTIGYMAPEYGVGSQATTYGDVYSFGIILLEILTGMRPTDPMFEDGLNLHNFVRAKLPGEVLQVLDPVLITTRDGADVIKCIASVLEIGISCSAEHPGDRMNMRDASRKLNVITEAFLRTTTRRVRHILAK